MTGSLRVNRCRACRGRKIKCDENWPTCGYCQRTNKICSGPPAAFSKFVSWSSSDDSPASSDGGGDETRGDSQSDSSWIKTPTNSENRPTEERALIQVREQPARVGGGVFMKLRSKPKSKSPQSSRTATPPSTDADTLIQQLVWIIEDREGAARDIHLNITWIDLLPSRLDSSPALCDATRLYINSWSKAQEAEASGTTIDRKAYVSSLQSLRLALDHPQRAFDVATLAATLLIFETEFKFNVDRPPNQTSHTAGLQTLMKARGPPRIDDELDVQLCFDVLSVLLAPTILSGTPVFFYAPEWLNAMTLALQSGVVKDVALRMQYGMYLLIIHWPSLAVRLKELYANPSTASALELAMEAGEVAQSLLEFDENWITPLMAHQSQVWVIPDNSTPEGVAYQFADWTTCFLVAQHAMASIAVNQIQHAALALGSMSADYLNLQMYEMSERIWMLLAYTLTQPAAARSTLVAPLVISYEHVKVEHREMYAEKAKQLLGSRAVIIKENAVEVMLATSRALTGRPSA